MKAIVTGCAGFVGCHLARRLLDEGHDVIGIDSYTTGQAANVESLTAHSAFRFIQADISDGPRVDDRVEMLFNLACPASPVDFRDKAVEIMRTCSVGVHQMLELARRDGAVFLQASTSECYGDPPPEHHPQREDYWGHVNPIGPRAPYDEGKRFAEALTMTYHRNHGLPTRIVRIFNTYGPRMRADDGRALPTFIMQALRHEPITVHGDGSQTRSFCYVDDLVEAILRAARSDCVEPINIGNAEEVTIRQTAEEVVSLCGSRSEVRFVDRPINDPDRRRPDLSKARKVLDWAPRVSRADGFRRTVDFFRSPR